MIILRGLVCGAALGCAAMTMAAPRAKAPPIPAPDLPADYRVMVEKAIRASLRDPSSGVVEFRSEPYKMVCHHEVFRTAAKAEVWMVEVWVNGTNAYGGYTGFQPMSATVRSDGAQISYQAFTKPGGGALTRFGLCKRV